VTAKRQGSGARGWRESREQVTGDREQEERVRSPESDVDGRSAHPYGVRARARRLPQVGRTPLGPTQMNSGTSSPLASNSVSAGLGELQHARMATARLPSNTSPGWRPAQSSQPISPCGRIPSVPACRSRIGFSMPPISSIDCFLGGMRDKSLHVGLENVPRKW